MLDAYVGYDLSIATEPDDIPKTNDTVWILGKQYNATDGKVPKLHLCVCVCVTMVTQCCLSPISPPGVCKCVCECLVRCTFAERGTTSRDVNFVRCNAACLI